MKEKFEKLRAEQNAYVQATNLKLSILHYFSSKEMLPLDIEAIDVVLNLIEKYKS